MPRQSKHRVEPNIPPELRDHLDALLRRYKDLRAKEHRLRLRYQGRKASVRMILFELQERLDARCARFKDEVGAISREFLEAWDKHFPDLPSVAFPSCFVVKRRDLDIEVGNKRELIDALDRIDHLDLVDYVFDLKGIRKLVRKGEFTGASPKALKVREKLQIQVSRRRKES
jgi:hypothetical protein